MKVTSAEDLVLHASLLPPAQTCAAETKMARKTVRFTTLRFYPSSSGKSTVTCWGLFCRKKDGKGDKEVNKAWNKYAKYTTVGDGKALWKAAAEELAAYAAQVRPDCQYVKLFSLAVHAHSTVTVLDCSLDRSWRKAQVRPCW